MPKTPRKLKTCAVACVAATAFLPTGSLSSPASVETVDEHTVAEQYQGGIHIAASSLSDQIQTKVFVTKRRRHGDFMDVNFRIEFAPVPLDKEYTQCFWDMGMQLNGAKPGCLEPGSVWPDENGKMVSYFEVTDFVKGEWIQVTIRSTDGAIRKSARFIPFKE